jgi:hypothetical protein
MTIIPIIFTFVKSTHALMRWKMPEKPFDAANSILDVAVLGEVRYNNNRYDLCITTRKG